MKNEVEGRLAALLRAANDLARARGVPQVAELVAEHAVALGAGGAALWVVDGVTATHVRNAAARDDAVAGAGSIALDGSTLLAEALRNALGPHGGAIVPLLRDDDIEARAHEAIGAIAFAGGGAQDETAFELLAAYATQALVRVRLGEAARRAHDAAALAARARAKLVSVVAHDLRNPLGVTQLKLEVMQHRVPAGDDGEQMRKDLRVIARSGETIAALVDDLLDVATIDAGLLSVDREPLAIADVVAEAVAAAEARARAGGVELVARSRLEGVTLLCDRERVLQVLAKLLGNAVKFSPPGGKVTVEAHADPEDVSFVVSDEGPGIAPEDRNGAFDRWARDGGHARAAKQGAGLGLYIARGIVSAHGGRIWIDAAESSTPSGARVAFTLPRA